MEYFSRLDTRKYMGPDRKLLRMLWELAQVSVRHSVPSLPSVNKMQTFLAFRILKN